MRVYVICVRPSVSIGRVRERVYECVFQRITMRVSACGAGKAGGGGMNGRL